MAMDDHRYNLDCGVMEAILITMCAQGSSFGIHGSSALWETSDAAGEKEIEAFCSLLLSHFPHGMFWGEPPLWNNVLLQTKDGGLEDIRSVELLKVSGVITMKIT